MKKYFIVLISLLSLGTLSTQSANRQAEHRPSNQKREAGIKTSNNSITIYYGQDNDRNNKDKQKERIKEIDHKLEILDLKYKRDKEQIDNSRLDKYDREIRKKELEYDYKRKKERLKTEKKAIKDGSFYSK